MKPSNIAFALLFAATLAAPFQLHAQATDEAPIMELLDTMAEKPEQHQAIADYYRKMAAEARNEASLHEKMKGTYRHSHAKFKGQPAGQATERHCKRVVELQQSMAEEYDALAELHESATKQ
ncbi:hypothetical protein [Parahaliea mediterranea]|uniref:hypothetical protein n=1 Tax=Parahaliea mediterranea TaxID=651086 RepID=UPI000C08FB0C|nr:hypothetical protein [Parahaliea mediterranea]MAC33768.1 hypothetical protein [Haliea sp.]|tara:strand:- start:2330 stop:2695 length:366 start_codon:yes stop_codon:yes gene_type:complete